PTPRSTLFPYTTLFRSQDADARSDVFALGLVPYEMLTGKSAFFGTSKASVMAAILEHEAELLPESVPSAIRHLIDKCLTNEMPEDRKSTRLNSSHDQIS